MAESAGKAGVEIWAYCVMPNNDGLVTVAPVLDRYSDFGAFLAQEPEDDAFRRLRNSETTGRPLGSYAWLDKLEQRTGKSLKSQKRGPKPKTEHLE